MLSLTPLSAALGEVILETRHLEQRWPLDGERTSIRRALAELHTEVGAMLVLFDAGRSREIDERGAVRVREAFLCTLVLALLFQRLISRTRRAHQASRRQLAAPAVTAVNRLLDAIDPFVARSDAALRRVMLDGVSSEQAASQIGLPV